MVDKASPILYCVEGHWNEPGDPSLEPSVEPLLQMLHRLGLWKYARRNAATNDELFYWLKNEWQYCPYGSVLYFATHGGPGEIWLSNAEPSSVVAIEQLLAHGIDCTGCLVHFSGCSILNCEEDRIAHFTQGCGAYAVSGYRKDVGWTARWSPAALLDLMLFSMIAEDEEIDLSDRESVKKLDGLRKEVQQRFRDCGFDLYLHPTIMES